MGRKKKDYNNVDSIDEVIEVKNHNEAFGQEDAEKLASSYIPSDDKRYSTFFVEGLEVVKDKFDVMYVTEDKNVFFKENEGNARNHAHKKGIKLFTVLNK